MQYSKKALAQDFIIQQALDWGFSYLQNLGVY